jgi:hypothetical protein
MTRVDLLAANDVLAKAAHVVAPISLSLIRCQNPGEAVWAT